jgi:Tfp pilus assembly protein FimV
LIREYTFLLDPPEFAAKTAAPAPSVQAAGGKAAAESAVAKAPPATSYGAAASSDRTCADGGGTYEVKRGETLEQDRQ